MIHFMRRFDLLILCFYITLACLSGSVRAATDAGWQQCMKRISDQAVQQNVLPATIEYVLERVEPLPRVISADRRQPEFTQTFTDYYRQRVTQTRVEKGRALLSEHADLLRLIQDRTGVPPHYLVALWGLETNFGSYFGSLSIPSALATLACDNRRSDLFTRELIAVMSIIEAGDMTYDELTGSWAGAIGHMQFMPSTFVRHAVDADHDGRINLIGSHQDALLSGANYLINAGWQTGYRWGREVTLPLNFDPTLMGLSQPQALSAWRSLGVVTTLGQPLPDEDLSASLLLPMGIDGPAFLVYPNFQVLMEWNRSQHYALSVGRLADRIAGAGRLAHPLPTINLSTKTLKQLQTQLNALGFDVGQADGILGPATRQAIQAFQIRDGLIADGFPNSKLIQSVLGQATAQQTDTAQPAAEINHPDYKPQTEFQNE